MISSVVAARTAAGGSVSSSIASENSSGVASVSPAASSRYSGTGSVKSDLRAGFALADLADLGEQFVDLPVEGLGIGGELSLRSGATPPSSSATLSATFFTVSRSYQTCSLTSPDAPLPEMSKATILRASLPDSPTRLGEEVVVAAAVGDRQLGLAHRGRVRRPALVRVRIRGRSVDDRLYLDGIAPDGRTTLPQTFVDATTLILSAEAPPPCCSPPPQPASVRAKTASPVITMAIRVTREFMGTPDEHTR